jgi:hypothetical protein
MVGGTIAFRDRRVPAHVAPAGSGPAQLDRPMRAMTTFVFLGVAIGLLAACVLIAKLIASDDHHEPY